MGRGIFLINDKNELVELREQPYENEDLLQRFLESHPQLLAGDEIDRASPRRWLLIDREVGVPTEERTAGRMDHLFVDQDGVPTLVEVKRSSDTRIRREVVGQMLDYAANAVVYLPIEQFREQFRDRCAKAGKDAERELEDFLGPASDQEAFWRKVEKNLRAGEIRMIFVADEIPSELRRIVEFLNQQMRSAEVLAVELKQFVGDGGLRTLVPTVFGQTAEAERVKGTAPGRQWDEDSFFDDLIQRSSEAEAAVAKRLLEWSRSRDLRIWWGKGQTAGSFVPVLDLRKTSHQLFAVYSYASLEVYFHWYAYKPPFDDVAKRMEMLRRLNEVPGIAIPPEAISRRPSIPLARLVPSENLSQFLQVFDWFLSEVHAAGSTAS